MAENVDQSPGAEHEEDDDKPGLRQLLHWATDDRDAEAEALADRAGHEVDDEAARLAVARAHGEVRDGTEPDNDDDLATVDDAKEAAQDTDSS